MVNATRGSLLPLKACTHIYSIIYSGQPWIFTAWIAPGTSFASNSSEAHWLERRVAPQTWSHWRLKQTNHWSIIFRHCSISEMHSTIFIKNSGIKTALDCQESLGFGLSTDYGETSSFTCFILVSSIFSRRVFSLQVATAHVLSAAP